MISDIFRLSINNIKHRKLRSWLTIIGIVIGIASIISLISIGQGLENAIEFQFSKMGTKTVLIFPPGLQGPPSGDLGLDKDMVDKVKSVKGVDYVEPMLLDYSDVEYNNEKFFIMINSYDTSLGQKSFMDMDIKTEKGRLFKGSDKGSVIIGYDVAYNLFDKDIGIRNKVIIKGKEFNVIGIFEKLGTEVDNRIFMPFDSMKDLFDKQDFVNIIRVRVQEGLDVDEVSKAVEKRLLKDYDDEDFDIYTPDQILEQLGSILLMVQFILGGIAAISLVVGGIGIMNSMFTSVLERTREIGIMKSIGATKSNILLIFLVESGFIGLIGGIGGIVLGVGFAKLVGFIAAQFGFSLLLIKIDVNLVLFSSLFSFVVGIISGIVPAMRASNLVPVEALRYE